MAQAQPQSMFSQFSMSTHYKKGVRSKVVSLQIASQDLLSKEGDLFSLLMDLHLLEDCMTQQHHPYFFSLHPQLNFAHFNSLILGVSVAAFNCSCHLQNRIVTHSYLCLIQSGLFDCDYDAFLIEQEDQSTSLVHYWRRELNF